MPLAPPATGRRNPLRRLDDAMRLLLHEIVKFGTVGVVNFAIDVVLFNLLRIELLPDKPVTCKAISTAVAATSSYFMNRHWTWRHRARTGVARELPLFVLLSAVGLGIAEACLAFSHYVLNLSSVLSDNVSANGFGLILGMIWRFWSFKRWVFLPDDPERDEEAAEATVRTLV